MYTHIHSFPASSPLRVTVDTDVESSPRCCPIAPSCSPIFCCNSSPFSGYTVRTCGILAPRSDLCHLQWKRGALTTGPPGRPLFACLTDGSKYLLTPNSQLVSPHRLPSPLVTACSVSMRVFLFCKQVHLDQVILC